MAESLNQTMNLILYFYMIHVNCLLILKRQHNLIKIENNRFSYDKAEQTQLNLLQTALLKKKIKIRVDYKLLFVSVHVWSVLDVLRDAADHPEYLFNVNSILVDKLVTYLLKLNSICTDRLGSLHTRIHPLM